MEAGVLEAITRQLKKGLLKCGPDASRQRILFWSIARYKHWTVNDKANRAIRDALAAYEVPLRAYAEGVSTVNSVLDSLIELASTEETSVKEDLAGLRLHMTVAKDLSFGAEAIVKRAEVVSERLDKICAYLEGDANEC